MMKVSRDEIYAYISAYIDCPNCGNKIELEKEVYNKVCCSECEEEIEIGD